MDNEDYLDQGSSEEDFDIPKSKSVPNLRGCVSDGSTMNATQLRQKAALDERGL